MYYNHALQHDETAIFNEYLHHAELPALDLQFDDAKGTVAYRWQADEPGFAMPIQAGDPQHWTLLHPTSDWQTTPGTRAGFQVATDLYYVQVIRDGVKESIFSPVQK